MPLTVSQRNRFIFQVALNSMSDEPWLYLFIRDSVQKKLCTTIGCTTCGAADFRNNLMRAYATVTGTAEPAFLHRESALGIAMALSQVKPLPSDRLVKFEEAARCVLYDLWYAVGNSADQEITPIISGSWAGDVLQSMKSHYENLQARRQEIAERQNPVLIEQCRARKQALKQERHQERLQLKKERDRIWYEQQGLEKE